MKKLILVLLAAFIFESCKPQSNSVSFDAMNTFMTVSSFGSGSKKANQKVQNRISELEKNISTTIEESDVFRLNCSNGSKIHVSSDTMNLIRFSLEMAQKTEGALNPCLYPVTRAWGFTEKKYRVPSSEEINELLKNTDFRKVYVDEKDSFVKIEKGMAFDFGAVGKGYAGDITIEILKEEGIKSAILDLGGNIQVLGKKYDGNLWNVGIKNPWDGNVCAGVKVSDKAVITSGGYERFFTADDKKDYIHIFDSKTGRPVNNNISSVTIISEKGLYGDSLSTAMFVKGLEGAEKFWKQCVKDGSEPFEMIIITEDKKIYYTKGLEGSVSVIFPFEEVTVIQ